jgi:hypothetical protein
MKTGWPPGLLQDDDRKLSRWFASRLDAHYQLRKNMTKDEVINALKMAQDALHMATLPFPIDEVKTRRALEAVDKVLDDKPGGMLFDDWGGWK